jgi:2-C-methyl-D-erythritol 4-phosphate cytidylyltransferase
LGVTSSWAVVLAAGSGSRFGGRKQLEMLGGRRVVDWAVAAARGACDGVVLVVDDPASIRPSGVDAMVTGGATRSESVRAGLAAVPTDVDVVVVHDAARPGASVALFDRVLEAVVAGADAAVPGVPIADTVKQVVVDERDRRLVTATIDRSDLVAVQTPQAFRRSALVEAHRSGGDATDDAGLVERCGGTVVVVDGETAAHKITTRHDLRFIAGVLELEQ